MTDRITARPDVASGIGTRYRGDSDTFDVFRNGTPIGTVDSTRDRTGNAFAILPNGERLRFGDANSALVYVARHGRKILPRLVFPAVYVGDTVQAIDRLGTSGTVVGLSRDESEIIVAIDGERVAYRRDEIDVIRP
jgi:hypothetical protein